MSTVTLKNVRLLSGQYEITNDHNQVSVALAQDAVEATTFGNDSRVFRPGLKTVNYTLNGYFDADGTSLINDIQAAQSGASTNVTIVAPDGAVGAQAYSFSRVESSLTPLSGSIGGMVEFTSSGTGTGDMFRGRLLEAGTTARTASANSTGYQMTAITSGQKGYAALHVLATTGSPTLDVDIASDDNAGFTSSTTYMSFTQATAAGSEFISDATAETDDYWRAEWTFGGTGSITFAVTFGIA